MHEIKQNHTDQHQHQKQTLSQPMLIRSINQPATIYGTEKLPKIKEKALTLKEALKLTLPDYSKLFLTEMILSLCLFQANNAYMKVNNETRQSLVLIKNLQSFSTPIIVKTIMSTNFLITQKIGEKKPEEVGQIIQQSYLLGIASSTPITLFLLLGSSLWGQEVSNYFSIYAFSLPAFAIAQTNFQALVALGKYKYVMGFGVFSACMMYGLTVGLTNGLKANKTTILPKYENQGLPLAMAISHVILAIMVTIWMHRDKEFNKYELRKCEHCHKRYQQIKKLFFLGAPLAIREIITNSYSLVFSAILVDLGVDAELMASIAGQAFMLMSIPLITTSIILTQQLGLEYGKWKQSQDPIINNIIQHNVKTKVKANTIIQYSILFLPLSCFLTMPQKINAFCENLSGSENILNKSQENQLAIIIQVLSANMFIQSFAHITTSICHAFQKTWLPMWFEFGGSIANAVAGWFFLKQLGLVAIDVGYIPTASVTGAALAYLAYKIINKISEPFSAELIELTGEQVDDTTGEMPFLLSSQEQVTIATQDTVSAVGYSQL
jgi:Na+-driven multidrug efflux pump